ncbi:hypothetical protein [Pseudoxanthomonas sp. JBR18]|uniref:hypothetical protein n=1 Tax=Pseudoxanthomonas sp. JBR18 TaxID=2969308 RepID=UPI0023055025|nr:hypothetical protein [Pseudoxanthomonas sp. JBR18]WCE02634.1 hypothetical protein PJ250_10770 [Pseudoxanthomonas sp. JBR18]
MTKKRWIALVFAGLSAHAVAQSGNFYEVIRYRDNDPFVFCTEGWKRDGDYFDTAWEPIPQYTGPWIPHWPLWCSIPTTSCPENYGYYRPRDWTQKDLDAWQQYTRVCPAAMNSGKWNGQENANDTPGRH